MSLLADLLSKVKHDKQERRESGVPPTLLRAVSASKERRGARKPLIIVGGLALAMVVVGFAVVYYMNVVAEPTLKRTAQRADLRRPPVQESVREQPAAPRVSFERPPDKSIERPAAKAERDEPVSQRPMGTVKGYADSKGLSNVSALSAAKKGISSKEPSARAIRSEKKASDAGSVEAPSDGKASGYPKDLTEQSRAKRDEFLYAARDCEADRDYDGALRYYKKALELDHRNYTVINNISGILISQGLYDEAAKYSRDALNIRKDYVPSLVNLGIALAQSGRIAEAEVYLLKARSLDASNRNAALNLGLLYEKTENYGEAQKLYPRLCEAEDAQGCLGAARVAERMGERDEAKKAYRKILTLVNGDSKAKKLASERLSFLESR